MFRPGNQWFHQGIGTRDPCQRHGSTYGYAYEGKGIPPPQITSLFFRTYSQIYSPLGEVCSRVYYAWFIKDKIWAMTSTVHPFPIALYLRESDTWPVNQSGRVWSLSHSMGVSFLQKYSIPSLHAIRFELAQADHPPLAHRLADFPLIP